jgi:hypothetical protein
MQEQWCEEERKGGLVQVTQRKRKGEKKGRVALISNYSEFLKYLELY